MVTLHFTGSLISMEISMKGLCNCKKTETETGTAQEPRTCSMTLISGCLAFGETSLKELLKS